MDPIVVQIAAPHATKWLREYVPANHFTTFEFGGLIMWTPSFCENCCADVLVHDAIVMLPAMTVVDAVAAGLTREDVLPQTGHAVPAGLLCRQCLDEAALDADEGESEARMIGMELGIDAYNDARGMSTGHPPYCDQCGYHHATSCCRDDEDEDDDGGREEALATRNAFDR